MTAAVAQPIARSLASIALDLATTHKRIADLPALSDNDDDDDWDSLTDRRDALQADFAAEFRRMTGVDWAVAYEVMA